jgi:hypothetical protein
VSVFFGVAFLILLVTFSGITSKCIVNRHHVLASVAFVLGWVSGIAGLLFLGVHS